MASVLAETVTRAPTIVHQVWWRGRLVQVAGIVALMYVAYRVWGLEYPWPNDLVWNSLSVHLDDFQTWLLTERGKEDQSLVFTVFEGFSSGIDHLVEWFNRLLIWLTWAGTTDRGRGARSALRRSSRRAVDALRVRDLRTVRPLGREHGDAGPDARRPSGSPSSSGSRWESSPAAPRGSAGRSRRCSTRCRSSPRSRT